MLQLEDQSWTVDSRRIRGAFAKHFKSIYCQQDDSLNEWPPEILQSLQTTLPRVQPEFFSALEQMPTSEEISKVVFNLGPDRAPGPDGINARFIQTYWDLLKPRVEQEVYRFFRTKEMPRELAKANMVLIPKCDAPTKVTDYRSISVCNVIYKVISKILANRLKPIIPSLVHANQVAFTPGRDISDQVILMREVLHTFSQSTFRQPAFCLKSDLSKAFDRMSWNFVDKVLELHGLPSVFSAWIMACIRSNWFTILFQGSGGGFITPCRGIRQGCALSPYVFILCMNILTSMLMREVQLERIRGLNLQEPHLRLSV